MLKKTASKMFGGYATNKLIKNVLISENGTYYKVVMIRYYNLTNSFYYTDQRGDESTCDHIKKWRLIE